MAVFVLRPSRTAPVNRRVRPTESVRGSSGTEYHTSRPAPFKVAEHRVGRPDPVVPAIPVAPYPANEDQRKDYAPDKQSRRPIGVGIPWIDPSIGIGLRNRICRRRIPWGWIARRRIPSRWIAWGWIAGRRITRRRIGVPRRGRLRIHRAQRQKHDPEP
jgi:hypothetical protein